MAEIWNREKVHLKIVLNSPTKISNVLISLTSISGVYCPRAEREPLRTSRNLKRKAVISPEFLLAIQNEFRVPGYLLHLFQLIRHVRYECHDERYIEVKQGPRVSRNKKLNYGKGQQLPFCHQLHIWYLRGDHIYRSGLSPNKTHIRQRIEHPKAR